MKLNGTDYVVLNSVSHIFFRSELMTSADYVNMHDADYVFSPMNGADDTDLNCTVRLLEV
jgi:hypothetical protein